MPLFTFEKKNLLTAENNGIDIKLPVFLKCSNPDSVLNYTYKCLPIVHAKYQGVSLYTGCDQNAFG